MLRPQRYKTLMGFILGLLLSVVLLGAGYAYYSTQTHGLSEAERAKLRDETLEAFRQQNPTGLVYIASKSKRAGDVLTDSDLIPSEISLSMIPEDAVRNIADAVGKVIRCDVTTYTAVTLSLLYDAGSYPDDVRLTEYTVVNLPQKLEPRQFIDVRIMFPNGLDYITLSKKQVIDLMKPSANQKGILWLHLSEEEILRMSSAIVDASIVEGAYLYAVPYVAPDIQKEARLTYPANMEVQNLILQDPNIVKKAVTQLEARNRKLFGDQINRDHASAGKNKVYGEDSALPATPQPTPAPAATGAASGSAVEGRL